MNLGTTQRRRYQQRLTRIGRAGRDGFALVIVMLVITVLAFLAGSFAYSMKVESRLARNSSYESEMEWLGRSGVEKARYVLGQSMNQPYTSLNQIWAGGPGSGPETNGVLEGLTLLNCELGGGIVSVRIVDMESRFNINGADEELLRRAMTVMHVDASDSPTIVDSIQDWRDPDDDPHLSGTESEYYLSLDPPYAAKNGPIDDLAELLLVRGVTPEMYWGPRVGEHQNQLYKGAGTGKRLRRSSTPSAFSFGLVDLFTPLANRQININTASLQVLQLLPGVDETIAANIIRARAGPDGVERTEDDTPFQNIAMLNPSVVPGISPQATAMLGRLASVTSSTFEVYVDVQVGSYRKRYVAVVRRNSPRDVPVLQFGWR